MTSKKLIASVIAFAMAAAVMPGVGQAATAEELAAQIAQLQAQLASLMGQLGTTGTTSSTVSGTCPAACAGISFTRNLTLGSQGTDVKCLQTLLNQDPATQVAATGVGSSGSETMYFGGLTKTAVIAFQNKYAAEILAPVGLTSGTGFVGASTRAKLNAMLAAGTTTTGETGGTTGETGGTTGETGGTGSGLSMTGAEGAITVSINPSPANNATLYEGDEKAAIYGLKIKATGSDVDVQRVTLKFSDQPYSYFTNVYLYDGDTQVASSALNSSTVSKVSSSDYQITLAGFTTKVIVPVNTSKALTVKVDVQPGISSGLFSESSSTKETIWVGTPSATAVRAVDQAGLNQYGGVAYSTSDATTYRAFTVNASQSSSATLTISANSLTPKARNIIADSSQKVEKATVLTFDMKATKDNLLVDSISNVMFGYGSNVPSTSAYSTTGTAGSGTYIAPTTAYLVDDSGTVIGSGTPAASGSLYAVSFTDLNYTVSKDTTKTFSIKIDDTMTLSSTNGATSSDDGSKFQAAVYGAQVAFTKTNGASGTGTGIANGNDAIEYAQGPIFTLASVTTTNTQAAYANSSSTISATFNIQVAATTGDVWIPDDTAFAVRYYVAGVDTGATTDITYSQPSNTVDGTNAWKVAEGTTATFAVTANKANGGVAGTYELQLSSIKWNHSDLGYDHSSVVTSSYMSTDSAWRSQAVYLK